MSGAQSWSVKGIDPKVREAAREAAARQGMSLGEYLNQALATQESGGEPGRPPQPSPQQVRTSKLKHSESEAAWDLGTSSPRSADPLEQRLESIERRTQLAVTGLDRAVSTIDRSLLGLAARLEDSEAAAAENAERVAHALDQFRIASETLSGRLERTEQEGKRDVDWVRERLETQVGAAEEIARRAEAAASLLGRELESRDALAKHTLSEAKALAEEAARQAAEASADAVSELRRMQEQMSERLVHAETSARRAVESAIAEFRSEAASETRATREALLEEVVRLEDEISQRVGSVEHLKLDQDALIARIERAEAAARETTAGLRQAAGAAIADLRNAQLTLSARVAQIEDLAGQSADLSEIKRQQQEIERRLADIETEDRRKVEHVEGAVRTLDQSLQRLTERLEETETTANTAIRTLEETVSSIDARIERSGAMEETEAVRALLEERLESMAQSVTQMVGEARSELAGQLQAALEDVDAASFESALADVNHRLAAAERRQAQTIEAISLEIKRMSETVDQRLRSVEARNDDAAAAAVREELSRMAQTLEQRFNEIESREAAAFDRMGLEIGRLSERLEERVGAVETRSAQAIEQVGEQVARMSERFRQRQDLLARELGERMMDSEERSSARVADAIGSIMQRLAEVEEHSAEAIAPVQKAVSNVASRLEMFERAHEPQSHASQQEPAYDAFPNFGDVVEPSPMDAAQPLRAGPLRHTETIEQLAFEDEDIYIAEDIEDLLVPETPQPQRADQTAFDDFEFSSDSDLLIEDVSDDEAQFNDDPPAEDETFWTPEPVEEALESPAPAPVFQADVPLAGMREPPPFEDAPEAPSPAASKNDYLANARRAAQAQAHALPRTRQDPAPTPRLSLRGSSRVVLWGAASLVAMLMVGGAWYIRTHDTGATVPEPQPATPPLAPVTTVDPFAEAPVEGLAPDGGAVDGAPIAQGGDQVIAGPLAPRNVSLEQAAQSGDLIAQYELALQRLSAGQTQDGVALLRRAADRGFAMAQYRLAKLYERGEGVSSDLTQARQWTERAAASGNRRAMHDLGVYFARGEGAPLDEAAAFRWFRQAAELGVADSQYNLGVLYQQGRGVTANPAEALFWFSVAARQGDEDAAARATALEAQLTPMQVEQSRARAQAFRPRAASGVANGEFGPRPWASRTGA